MAAPTGPDRLIRVRRDGKLFAAGGERFAVRGVTYGTFRPRHDGARFPPAGRIAEDFAAMAAAGFTVVRTYTVPPPDLLELAAGHGLRVLAGVFYPDWRYLVGGGVRRAAAWEAHQAVAAAAAALRGRPEVLALSIGNEIPADAIRWFGTRRVAGLLGDLTARVRDADPDLLVTYANYPTAEYLPLDDLDFLTFNVFLERRDDFRRYLTRLHHLAGDRPLVLGEVGLDCGGTAEGETRQADVVDWQLAAATERGVAGTCLFSWTDEWWVGDAAVEGWHFGLTRADRSPRPALAAAAEWNRRTVADLPVDWPGISVVICAYNASATLDECLTATCSLDYPDLEVVVVDDGSTDRTAEIARRHPGARLVEVPHGGLSVARNAGLTAATRPIVAYLDSDAYPSPEWPYYLALGFGGHGVVGAGGPNVPPPSDPPGAHRVAHAPGGPVHVLLNDDRAEHIPGCNMAFYKPVLELVGGFDPIYTSAGDDVDLCWRVLDRGYEIGFHPAALVWHHRRPGIRTYLRQQRGYGRAEALVEARHPDRFTAVGTARWRGRIYDSFPVPLGRQRVYRGLYGAAAYQSVYRGGGHVVDLAHQAGVPIAAILVLTAPLALIHPLLGLPALLALFWSAGLFGYDVARFHPPAGGVGGRRLGFRLTVALLHMLQPLVRTWARHRHGASLRRELSAPAALPAGARRVSGGAWLLPDDRPRADLATEVVAALRARGARIQAATGWEDHDARLVASGLVVAELLTSAHPAGAIQIRLRLRLRRARLLALAVPAAALALVAPLPAGVIAALGLLELARGVAVARVRLARALTRPGRGQARADDPSRGPGPDPDRPGG